MYRVKQQFKVTYSYPVLFTSHAFDVANPVLSQVLRDSGCIDS
jgi:hypothetical protein